MSDEPSESPADAAPAEPPLSIRHLMVWTACVAVHLSVAQTIARLLQLPASGDANTALWAVTGIWQGTGLAGILLLMVRRAQGLKFPRHGGEMLWIIAGIEAVMRLLRYPILFLQDSGWADTALSAYGLLNLTVWAAVYLYAFLQTKTRRWRVVFSLMFVAGIAVQVFIPVVARINGPSAMIKVSTAARFFQQVVIVASLLVASWIDLRQPHRYPWTHWAGVILYLLQFAGTALGFAYILIMLP